MHRGMYMQGDEDSVGHQAHQHNQNPGQLSVLGAGQERDQVAEARDGEDGRQQQQVLGSVVRRQGSRRGEDCDVERRHEYEPWQLWATPNSTPPAFQKKLGLHVGE